MSIADMQNVIGARLKSSKRKNLRLFSTMNNLEDIHNGAIRGNLGRWNQRHHVVLSSNNDQMCDVNREYFDTPKYVEITGSILNANTPRAFNNTLHGSRSLSVYMKRHDYHSADPRDSHRLGQPPDDNLDRARSPPLSVPGVVNKQTPLRPRTDGDKYPGSAYHRHPCKWDSRHHITVSAGNDQIHYAYRNYFDRPTIVENGRSLSPRQSRQKHEAELQAWKRKEPPTTGCSKCDLRRVRPHTTTLPAVANLFQTLSALPSDMPATTINASSRLSCSGNASRELSRSQSAMEHTREPPVN